MHLLYKPASGLQQHTTTQVIGKENPHTSIVICLPLYKNSIIHQWYGMYPICLHTTLILNPIKLQITSQGHSQCFLYFIYDIVYILRRNCQISNNCCIVAICCDIFVYFVRGRSQMSTFSGVYKPYTFWDHLRSNKEYTSTFFECQNKNKAKKLKVYGKICYFPSPPPPESVHDHAD